MMRGTWIICRKELNSYFASPIAYSVMALFAFLFGLFFYISVTYFMQYSMESAMQGRSMPMNINEMIIRPLFNNMSTIVIFLAPMLASCFLICVSQMRNIARKDIRPDLVASLFPALSVLRVFRAFLRFLVPSRLRKNPDF